MISKFIINLLPFLFITNITRCLSAATDVFFYQHISTKTQKHCRCQEGEKKNTRNRKGTRVLVGFSWEENLPKKNKDLTNTVRVSWNFDCDLVFMTQRQENWTGAIRAQLRVELRVNNSSVFPTRAASSETRREMSLHLNRLYPQLNYFTLCIVLLYNS